MLIGYARVSTSDQSLEPQLQALAAAGVAPTQIHTDVASGARTERWALDRALSHLREGDTLVVWNLDRLGRSLEHLIAVMQDLEQRGVGFRSLTQGIDTSTPAGKLVFGIFGAIAEFERSLIRERTKAGLAAARARGRKGGRKAALTPAKKRLLQQMAKDNSLSVTQICTEFNISESTYYRHAFSPDS
jgi:DNA invertase Pin-like site-specific DNA recombinase